MNNVLDPAGRTGKLSVDVADRRAADHQWSRRQPAGRVGPVCATKPASSSRSSVRDGSAAVSDRGTRCAQMEAAQHQPRRCEDGRLEAGTAENAPTRTVTVEGSDALMGGRRVDTA